MSGFTQVTVVGQLTDAAGKPAAWALVTATLSEPIQNGVESRDTTPYSARTSSTGVFQIKVPANTDPGTFPAESFYTFVCSESGLESEVIVQPAAGLVPFASLAPVPSSIAEVASVFGRTGKIVAEAGDYTAAEVTGAASETFAEEEAEAIAAAAVKGTVAPTIFVIPVAAAAPGAPVEGEAYFDTAKGEVGVFVGEGWVYTGKLV